MNIIPVSAQPDLLSLPVLLKPPSDSLSPYVQLTISRALRLLEKQLHEPGVVLTSCASVCDWLRLHLAIREREVFIALYLDNRHRLIAHDTLFLGTINKTEIHSRKLLKTALRHNAAAVIVAHNHPSGHAEPSSTDRQLTIHLREVLELVDIRLLDHLVVGGMDIIPFTERGWL